MTDELIGPIPLETPKPVPADAIDSDAPAIERPRHRARTRFFVAFLISLLAGLAVGAGALYAYDREYTGRVLPGVSVGGIDLSGLSPDAAAAKLHDAYDQFGEGQAVVVGGGFEMPIDYAKIDRRANVDQMVAEAMAVGRSGNLAERVILDARTAIRGRGPGSPRAVRRGPPRSIRPDLRRPAPDRPEDAAVVEKDGAFVVVEGTDGQVADRISPTEFLTAALARTDAPAEIRVELEVAAVEPRCHHRRSRGRPGRGQGARRGHPRGRRQGGLDDPRGHDPEVDHVLVGRERPLRADREPGHATASLTTLASEVEIKGKNASFTISGGNDHRRGPRQSGRAWTSRPPRPASVSSWRRAPPVRPIAPVEPALSVTAPNLTTEEAQAVVSKMKKISTWTTYFPITEKNGFGNNIWIPALDIDGYVVGPGEKFDFWNAVGPVTRDRGYRDGGAIINGKTEPQGALARRHLLVLDDAVQRRAPGRLRDGRPPQPLLLHRPLPDSASTRPCSRAAPARSRRCRGSTTPSTRS